MTHEEEAMAENDTGVLFTPLRVGDIDMRNRIVMAPMTRSRADADGVPTARMQAYYEQRSSAGLIISEGTQPSLVGKGYTNTPGLHSREQIAAWRRVTDAVHRSGAPMVAQIMHAGRAAHPDNKEGAESVAPSAIPAPNLIVTATGRQAMATPRALETEEVESDLPGEFVTAARNAVDAGFDGVELHGANGYILHQFLSPAANQRTDRYGGSPSRRAAAVIGVIDAVADAIGPGRVGIRFSPQGGMLGADEPDPAEAFAVYDELLAHIDSRSLAYVSLLTERREPWLDHFRRTTDTPLIVNTGFSTITSSSDAEHLLSSDLADAVAVGRQFIANPDLPSRWRNGLPLNTIDEATFYQGDDQGYVDYPFAATEERS